MGSQRRTSPPLYAFGNPHILLCDVHGQKPPRLIPCPSTGVLTFSPNAKWLVLEGYRDPTNDLANRLKVWDIERSKLRETLNPSSAFYEQEINSIAVAPDNASFVTMATGQAAVQLWDRGRFQEPFEPQPQPLDGKMPRP